MTTLLIATRNRGKAGEFAALLAGTPYETASLSDIGIDREVEETGATFRENAELKARAYADVSGLPTLADDSGLEVDCLGGEPGVRSSRYAGEHAGDAERVAFLLRKLKNIPRTDRSARFVCVIAVSRPEGPVLTFEGRCDGEIVDAPRGERGFGYDPIFLLPDLGRTMAELSSEQKNRVSHRARACRRAVHALRAGHWRI